MKEKPIIFSAPMVRAILEGRKTQTRRFVKRQPPSPGDNLWVRETWQYWNWTEEGEPYIKYLADEKVKLCNSDISYEWAEKLLDIWADLSEPENYNIDQVARDRKRRPSIFMPKWASRIKLAVTETRFERLQKITKADILSEGIRQISKDNGKTWKYGISDRDEFLGTDDYGWPWQEWSTNPKKAFIKLWESINGAESWKDNPMICVIKFKII